MSVYRWHRVAVYAALAVCWALAVCACGGSNEAGSEHAESKAQALVASIPGRIEAESYERDLDSTPDVNYGAYNTECDRKDGVDIDLGDDPTDPGCEIGWTTAGEWLEYDIQVPATQSVDITARVASNLPDRQFHISIDGVSLAEQTLPTTDTWDYTNVTYSAVALSAGGHVLRFTFDNDSIDLNYIDVTATSAPPLVETLLPASDAVASSSQSDAFPASFVIDGDSTTRWSSEFSDPQWIYVDLGKVQQLSRVILNWELAASQSYQIAVSDSSDGPWTVVYSTTTGDGGVDDISFTPVAARYVRMSSSARATAFGNSLYDFDVYGEVPPDPSCTPDIAGAPDDGAQVATGTLLLQQGNSFPHPSPTLDAAFMAPGMPNCDDQCLDGSVLDNGTLVARSAPVWVSDGTAHIFAKGSDGSWAYQGLVANPELSPWGALDITFAYSLALSGDDLLLSGTAYGTNKVYVFGRSGSAWTPKQTLIVNAQKLALDHGTALVTTSEDVRVYQRGSNGLYRLQTLFDVPEDAHAPEATADEGFGAQLALDSNVAVIGAPGQYTGNDLTQAYVYERCGLVWSFAQRLAPPDGSLGTNFGAAVAVSGNQIAVGEPDAAGPSADRKGAVQTFVLAGSEWVPDQSIVNPIPEDGQIRNFGSALALRDHLLLVSFKTAYPFGGGSYNYLYDVNGAPRFLVALIDGNANSVQISGHDALIDVEDPRADTDPDIFELPY
jgi:hypothetical protein